MAGWEITLYPVSERDLQRFVFDVLGTPTLLEARLAELRPDAETWQTLRELFGVTLKAIEQEKYWHPDDQADEDREEDDEYEDDEDWPPSAARGIVRLALIVANCRHPGRHSRVAGLPFTHDIEMVSQLTPLSVVFKDSMRDIDDGVLQAEFSGSFITAADVRTLATRIKAGDPAVAKGFGGVETPEWKALSLVVDYAATRDVGLLRAPDATILGSQLRPDFLKYVEVHDDVEPRNPTTAMKVLRIGVGLLILVGAPLLIESGIGLRTFVILLFATLIVGRIAMRELQSRTDE